MRRLLTRSRRLTVDRGPSADGAGTASFDDAFDMDAAWVLHPQVAVRPEPFGALLYHFGTRRLSFLRDPALGAVVRTLGDRASARASCVAAGVTEGPDGAVPDRVVAALATLARTSMIVKKEVR